MIGSTVLLGLDCILALISPLTSETKHIGSCNNNFWRVSPQTYIRLSTLSGPHTVSPCRPCQGNLLCVHFSLNTLKKIHTRSKVFPFRELDVAEMLLPLFATLRCTAAFSPSIKPRVSSVDLAELLIRNLAKPQTFVSLLYAKLGERRREWHGAHVNEFFISHREIIRALLRDSPTFFFISTLMTYMFGVFLRSYFS